MVCTGLELNQGKPSGVGKSPHILESIQHFSFPLEPWRHWHNGRMIWKWTNSAWLFVRSAFRPLWWTSGTACRSVPKFAKDSILFLSMLPGIRWIVLSRPKMYTSSGSASFGDDPKPQMLASDVWCGPSHEEIWPTYHQYKPLWWNQDKPKTFCWPTVGIGHQHSLVRTTLPCSRVFHAQ